MPRVLQQRLLSTVGSLALVATLFAAYARDVRADSGRFCSPNRGAPDSPLLLVNHWISPVSPSAADAANTAEVLADRVAMCEAERSMTPNLIAGDFSDRGDLLDYVRQLNHASRR